MGSSLAYHLASMRNTGSGIVVVEKDSSYKTASATLSAGGVRQQFSLRENVLMSLYGIDFVKRANEILAVDDGDDNIDVQLQERGYLFLASEAGREALLANHAVQKEAGADWMALLSPDELRQRFPWLSTDGIAAGSLGLANEGWFDPWALLRGMRRKAQSLGVTYVEGEPVGATCDDTTRRVASVDVATSGSVEQFRPRHVVNAAGAHARPVLDLLAAGRPVLPLPVAPRKRCIFYVRCPSSSATAGEGPSTVPLYHAPLTVDTSGVYFRPEGHGSTETFICGVSPNAADDADVWDAAALSVGEDDHSALFEEVIWPALYNRVEAFGELKVQASWAGWYEYNTFDQNAIIGWHPDLTNVALLNGFSGHGLQQSPAAGRAVAELIERGRFDSLDLSLFGLERVQQGRPVYEMGIV